MNKKQLLDSPLRPPKMAHVRHIKPEYAVHEGVCQMSIDARYAHQNSWCHADKNGNFEWKPRSLKLKVMPFDEVNFEALMLQWVKFGFCVRYEVDGQQYGHFPNWEKHQFIGNREKESRYGFPSVAHVRTSTKSSLLEQTRAMSEGQGQGQGKVEGYGEVEVKGVPSPGASRNEDDDDPPNKKTKRSKPKTKTGSKTVSFSLPDRTSPEKSNGSEGKDADNEKPSVGCVGDIAWGDLRSLESMLFVLSDGIFERGALQNHGAILDELKKACERAIEKFSRVPFTDRKVLASILNEVMTGFGDLHLKYPPGLLKAKRILDSGGPVQTMRVWTPATIFGDVLSSTSALDCCRAKLLPHQDLLQRIANRRGVPTTFHDAVNFLDEAVACAYENNEGAGELKDARAEIRELEPESPWKDSGARE